MEHFERLRGTTATAQVSWGAQLSLKQRWVNWIVLRLCTIENNLQVQEMIDFDPKRGLWTVRAPCLFQHHLHIAISFLISAACLQACVVYLAQEY